MGCLYTLRWPAHMICAPGVNLGACISCARDASAWRVNLSRQMHASEFLLRLAAIFAVGFLRDSELFKCLPYDWGITDYVHVQRNLNMFLVQFIICLNGLESTLNRSHAFIVGNVAQVQ